MIPTSTPSTALSANYLLPDLSPSAVVAAGRSAEFHANADRLRSGIRFLALENRPSPTPKSLHIVILAPRVDVGGGARILFEHANRLTDRGHQVEVLAHYPEPDWCELRSTYRHVPVGYDLSWHMSPCDLIVCGYWDQLAAARSTGLAPVVHFEQGDFHLFEETIPEMDQLIRANLAAADLTVTVSNQVARILADRYQITDVYVAHNAVDLDLFRPGSLSSARDYVFCVGWDGNEFKGIADIRTMWAELHRRRPDLRLVWVSPRPPRDGSLGEVVVAPTQQRLAELYRGAAVYLCASHYESFPLPPLESMASGTPVVTTSNLGVLEYAVHEENALVVPIGDAMALAKSVERVLDDVDLATQLAAGGLETAMTFAWDRIIDRLEARYRSLCARRIARIRTTVEEWKRGSCQATPEGDDAARLLEETMDTTQAREIWIPVSRPFGPHLRITSWELAVERIRGGRDSAHIPARHLAGRWRCTLPYRAGLDALRAGRLDDALNHLVRDFGATASPPQRGSLAKWLVVTLIGLGRLGDAGAVIRSAFTEFPDNPDLIVLAGIVARPRGFEPGDMLKACIGLIGCGARYLDWFSDPVALLEDERALSW